MVLHLLLIWPLIRGEVYAYNDLLTYHLPTRVFYAHCLKNGESSLWHPFMFCGFYLHGEGQVGMTHPLHWLTYKYLPLHVAFGLEFFLSYPFMLIGMYLLLRRWGLPSYAAMVGGIVFAFSGFHMLHYIHLNAVAIIAHVPWLMFLADSALRSTHLLRVALARFAVCIVVASQLLLGHPHFVWFSGLALTAYLLLVGPGCWTWRRMTGLVSAGMVGFLIGSVQWLPSLDLVKSSVRADASLGFRLLYSLHPVRLAEMILPQVFFTRDHEFAVYNGAVTLLLAIVVLIRWKRLGAYRRITLWALVLVGLGIWLALGRHGLLYRAVTVLPVVGRFRCPSRYMYFVHFAQAVLAAIGIRELALTCYLRDGPSRCRCWPLMAPLLVALLVAYLALTVAPAVNPDWDAPFSLAIASSSTIIIGAATVTLAAISVYLAMTGRRAMLAGVILLLLIDHGCYGATYIYSRRRITVSKLREFVARSPFSHLPRNRMLLTIRSNEYTVSGFRLADGDAGLAPSTGVDGSLELLRVAGVARVHAGHNVPDWLTKTPRSDEAGWNIPRPLPRARLVTRAVRSDNPAKDIREVDVDRTVLLDRHVKLSSGHPGQVTITEDRPGRIALELQARGRELLVVSERIHNGWQAYVDGKPTSVLPAYGIFMAVPIERGTHVVELTFRPRSYVLGKNLMILGSVLSLLYLGLSLALCGFGKRDELAPTDDTSSCA